MLKDGSDSVGVLGAFNRVYLNIGLFSEEWLLHFNPFFGGKRITPIGIAMRTGIRAYWQATELDAEHGAVFPQGRAAGPAGGRAGREPYLKADAATLERGKTVFAETCARCHSSKLPRRSARELCQAVLRAKAT